MSYLVLARKYRPRNFAEMVGQDHVVQALSNALATQRLHHAYLFTGTRGVGKTTVSRILAKSLNCQGPDGNGGITATPCGTCQACADIDGGRFVNYTELDAASNRGVDEVQALLEQAVYKPVQGRFKVFMVDEVHMLTGHAFNAMLKSLEEPPPYLKFILATTDPQKVPVTVLSRCLQFNLRPMAPETIREHLHKVVQAENVPADLQALRLLATAARGSMRDALSLTDQAIAFGAGRLDEATVRQMLGSVDRGYVFRLLQALAEGDGKAVVEISETLRLHGLSAASTLEEMSAVLQRMAVRQMVADVVEDEDDCDPYGNELARLAALLPADETQLLYSICLHGRAELGLAPDEYAALTMVLLRLLAFKRAPPGPGPDRITKPTAVGVASKPAPAAPDLRPLRVTGLVRDPQPNRPISRVAPSHTATEIVAIDVRSTTDSRADADVRQAALIAAPEGEFWYQIVCELVQAGAITAMARELALQSQLVARDTDQWILRVEREALNQTASRERLASALVSLGYTVLLAVEVGRVTDTPVRRNAALAAERQMAAEKLVFEDPFVQGMTRDFGAKIVPGSIRPETSTGG